LWTLTLIFNFAVSNNAQIRQTSSATLNELIARDRQSIQQAQQQHLADEHTGYLWAVLAAEYRKAGDFVMSEDAYFKAVKLLDHDPSAARNYATTLDNLSMLYLTYGRLEEAEQYNKKGARIRGGLGVPLDSARSEEHRAEIDLARHRFKAAENTALHALEVMTRLEDPEKSDILSALNVLTFSLCSQKKCLQGNGYAQRSLTLARSAFGEQSAPTGHSLMAVGFAQWKLGQLEDADRTMQSAIRILKTQQGVESRSVVLAMLEYRNYLKGVHRDNDAEAMMQEISLTTHQQTLVCATCVNVHALSNAMR
jgi:tetratricopeptide (TPR) repeat protein